MCVYEKVVNKYAQHIHTNTKKEKNQNQNNLNTHAQSLHSAGR